MLSEPVALGLINEWLFEGNAKRPPHQNTIGHRWRMPLSGLPKLVGTFGGR